MKSPASQHTLHFLGKGGMACVLRDAEGVAIRIEDDYHDYDGDAIHRRLSELFPACVPRIFSSKRVAAGAMPAAYTQAVVKSGLTSCIERMLQWTKVGCRVTRMECATLGSLRSYCRATFGRQDALAPEKDAFLRQTALQLYSFLFEAQERLGFEHGDLTSGNIVLAQQHERIQAQLIDFDYARLRTQRAAKDDDERELGSPWVMPPEALIMQPRHIVHWNAIDVWSLGIDLLSEYLGVWNLFVHTQKVRPALNVGCHATMAKLIDALLVILHDKDDEEVDPTLMTMLSSLYRAAINALPPTVLEFFRVVLHRDAAARVMHANTLFNLPFFDGVSGVDELRPLAAAADSPKRQRRCTTKVK